MAESPLRTDFNPWRIVVPVVALLLSISIFSVWYGRTVSIPRYCADPQQSLNYLQRVLTDPRPAEERSQRPYVIAAKLLFLIPQQSDEPVDRYLHRVAGYLTETCR